ncbi:MAG: ADP-ribosylglycohydrolase family protein [Thermodesulfobacteriota bacterium]
MKENAAAMVLACFAADSLALGVHWIYDTALIDKQFGRVEHLLKPSGKSYHPTKDRGELTHYGDQTLMLLDLLAGGRGFNLENFSRNWQDLFITYQGYRDQASRRTLENFKSGKGPHESGSPSADLGGAARITPLVYYYRQDPNRLFAASRDQTAMTHNHPHVIDSAEFFGRTALKALHGTSPAAAVKSVVAENFNRPPFDQWVSAGFASAGMETRTAISGFGQMCEIGAAFPAVIHLLARYEDNLKEALVENVMAGGDSAARGMITGMMLGAYLGMEAIPADWLAGLKTRATVMRALSRIDSQRK